MRLRFLLIVLFALLPQVVYSQSIRSGRLPLTAKQLQPGKSISLIGNWLNKPGYAVKPDEQPQVATTLTDYVSVPVPQFLNRTQWWLDDSEDFKKFEEARLKKLGFDTESAEDGWYQLVVNTPSLPKHSRLFVLNTETCR